MYKYTCVDGYLSCLLIQLKSDTLSWKPSAQEFLSVRMFSIVFRFSFPFKRQIFIESVFRFFRHCADLHY